MKQILSLVLCFLLLGALPVRAEEVPAASTNAPAEVVSTNTPVGVVSTENAEGWKAESAADKAKIKEERNKLKESAKAARVEEKDLHKQIREAQAAGDTAKVEALKAQLKTTHQENVAQLKQDKKDLGAAKKELRTDRKAAGKTKAKEKGKKRGWWGN
jgi:hypothetical protein